MSEASRTFGRVSGNIANPSKSENCQDNFRDLQKDLVVLLDLMLLFTYQTVCVFNIYKGKKDLSGVHLFRFAQRQVCKANVARQLSWKESLFVSEDPAEHSLT